MTCDAVLAFGLRNWGKQKGWGACKYFGVKVGWEWGRGRGRAGSLGNGDFFGALYIRITPTISSTIFGHP